MQSTQQRAGAQSRTDRFDGDELLAVVTRGGYVANAHRGVAAAVRWDGSSVLAVGDQTQPVFLRSAAKPFQLMPAVISGAIDRFGVTQQELSVLCASHNAEPIHMQAVLSVLARAGLTEAALRCGAHPPLHEPTARRMVEQGELPTPVCNNCSGAHTGMLLACVANGWDQESYGQPDHPLQQQTLRLLAAFSDVPSREIEFGVDNCHVPAFRLPIRAAALAFARFAAARGVEPQLQEAARRIGEAMMAYPYMVGGEHRFDTDVMQAVPGALIAKGGAEGFQGIGLPATGIGLALKVSDGAQRAVAPVALDLLQRLDAIDPTAARSLTGYAHTDLYDHMGELVGSVESVLSAEETG